MDLFQHEVLAGFFFWGGGDIHGILRYEFAPSGETVNHHSIEMFCGFYRKMCGTLEIVSLPQQCSPHSPLSEQEFVAKNGTTAVLYPPHSLDLAPCDILLFPELKLALEGRFDDIMRQKYLQATLVEFETQDLCKCFQQWHKGWALCNKSNGNYFKGDSMEWQVNEVTSEKRNNPDIFRSHLVQSDEFGAFLKVLGLDNGYRCQL
jgi:hypothetical protein